jgi:hypothetical protein
LSTLVLLILYSLNSLKQWVHLALLSFHNMLSLFCYFYLSLRFQQLQFFFYQFLVFLFHLWSFLVVFHIWKYLFHFSHFHYLFWKLEIFLNFKGNIIQFILHFLFVSLFQHFNQFNLLLICLQWSRFPNLRKFKYFFFLLFFNFEKTFFLCNPHISFLSNLLLFAPLLKKSFELNWVLIMLLNLTQPDKFLYKFQEGYHLFIR